MHVEVNVLYELLTMFGDDAAPIEPGAVSKALQNDLREKGLEELTGLLCFLKVTTRKTLATLGDRHFRQICSTAQAASIAPGLMVALRDHRRASREAADAASTAEGNEAVEKGLLAIAARATRKLAVELLSRDCPAREPMAAAYHKLHAFTSTSEEDPHAGVQAAADAYIEHRAAMLGCLPEMDEFLKDAAVPVRDALVLSCMSLSGYRNRDDFATALEDVFGRVIDDDKVDSQLHNTYSHLMGNVPGAFTSRSKMRTRRARHRVVRAQEAEPEPEQADGEAPDASTVSTAASTTAPAVHVPPFQPAYINPVLTPGFGAEDRNGGYNSSALEGWSHADYNGYQYFRSGSAVFAREDFAQVEPNQAAKDPLNGAMIRRLFGDRWYGALVMSIHEKHSTGDWWYAVRYQDGTIEILQDYIVQQGWQDLHGPPPPHADPGMLQERYAKNAGFSKASKMQSDVESENTDDDGLFLDGIEEEPSEHTSKLQEYLAAALKEVSRLRLGLEPLAVAEGAASEPELTLGSDGNGQEEQLFYDRLGVLAETLNTELVSLKPFQTFLWLGKV